ncbi:hypothetical protein FJT64_014372 [Amphibalanus amphitrite]|uniref:Uncharacterized protein n=1 Tax=Amphibalanus amphitrite TaxID=1232801 RepID=A0A6A4UX33_AMPAM|nr:hypothetical protein FJT64_014372 [Amphibalanus amphitrite]
MADLEFEEFRRYFDRLPQHIKAPEQSYRLVHDVAPGEPTAPESSSEGDSAGEETSEETRALHSGRWEPSGWAPAHEPTDADQHRQPQRRRRLPEIPKSKRRKCVMRSAGAAIDPVGGRWLQPGCLVSW